MIPDNNPQRLDEFDIIHKFFEIQPVKRHDVVLGIGDDAALVQVPSQENLAITTDTLIEDIHFPKTCDPTDLGYKSLAVNLSDLAAMGAAPAWATLAITIPSAKQDWLQAFANGFYELARKHEIQLIGGNTARGPLSITVQAFGFVPPMKPLLRNGAKPGDIIYVSGTLGDAGLGLAVALKNRTINEPNHMRVLERFYRPTPRITLGTLLRDYASSAIDISDGLLADLKHILDASKVGAKMNADKAPMSLALKQLSDIDAKTFALTAGEDYELCFTVPPHREKAFQEALLQTQEIACTPIGEITANKELIVANFTIDRSHLGYQHF